MSSQLSAVPGAQTPPWQVSEPLQTLVSAHDVPFATGACWQPVIGSHVSAVQGLLSTQLSGGPGVQTPARQLSAPLQTVASRHGEPSDAFVCWQPATGSHASVVHLLPSSQLRAVPGVQTPPWQVSSPLQTVAS